MGQRARSGARLQQRALVWRAERGWQYLHRFGRVLGLPLGGGETLWLGAFLQRVLVGQQHLPGVQCGGGPGGEGGYVFCRSGFHPLAECAGGGQHLQPGVADDPEPDRGQPYAEHRVRYLGGGFGWLHPVRRAHPHGGVGDARGRNHHVDQCGALCLSQRAAGAGRRRVAGAFALGRGGEGQGHGGDPDGCAGVTGLVRNRG